ncbi:dipeptidyl-peptidase IV [Clostridium paraputrificum]|uniref:dipeptidyl-peptidase IV n=1 Tax=Clostridium TaxID=1485 RepID=UPI003D343766
MNMFKKVITWAMLSIMMQLAGLLFLDKVVFQHSSDFKVKEVEAVKKEAVSINVPTSATEVSSAYSGRYVSYKEGDKLMLVNTKTSETKEVLVDKGAEIIYSSWLPKDNYLIIGEKVKGDSGSNIIRVVTYNPRTGTINPVINELCTYQKGMQIDSIVSSGSGTKYVSVSRGGFNSTIYRIDINDKKRELPSKVANFGGMKVFQHKDELVYENALDKTFYRYTNMKLNKLKFNNSKNLTLLSVDDNDNIYMGEMVEDKISKIIYGKADVNTSSWTTVTLEKSKNPEDIHVNSKSEIMINDNLEGKITNLTTGDTISYEGMFIQLTDKIICSSSNGKLFIKSLSDVDKKEEVKDKK